MDCNLPGSSVHGILQARILEWVAISISRGPSRPRDQTWMSRIAGRFFTVWATRESLLTTRWWSRKTCAHLLQQEHQNYNSLLNNCRQENVGSHRKKIPHVQEQTRSSSKTVGGAKSCLESNPIPARDTRKAQTNLECTRTQRPHRDWARTVFECVLWRNRSAVACYRGRGFGCSRPGYGISSLGGGRH